MNKILLYLISLLGQSDIFVFRPAENNPLWNAIRDYLIQKNLANKVYSLFIRYNRKINTIEIVINTSYLSIFNVIRQNELELFIINYIDKNPLTDFVNSKKKTFKISLIVNDFRLHSENLKELFV